jgi:hypothetical protein
MESFKNWLLSEIRQFAFSEPMVLRLPGKDGEPLAIDVEFIDPRFERYNPDIVMTSHSGEKVVIPYLKACANGGTGWQAPLPMTKNEYLIYDASKPYGMIGPDQKLPVVQGSWWREAEFADKNGVIVYYAKIGIFNTPDPRNAAEYQTIN